LLLFFVCVLLEVFVVVCFYTVRKLGNKEELESDLAIFLDKRFDK